MTMLDERISLELEMDLMALFSESSACEVDAHDEQPYNHEGDGEWCLIGAACIHCGNDEEVLLICDKFKRVLEENMEYGNVPCSECPNRRYIKDIVIRFEKKGAA